MKQYDDKALAEAYVIHKKCRIVAGMFGCSDETVRRALIRYSVPRVVKHPRTVTKKKATEEELREIVAEYYAENVTINDLAKKHRRAQHTISEAIKEYGHGLKVCAVNGLKISDEQILSDIAEGLTRQEIADRHGVHVENLARRMRVLGVHAKRAKCQKREPKAEVHEWHYSEGCRRFVEEHQSGFEFVSFKRGRCRLRCRTCGYVIERARSTIRQKKCLCDECERRRQEEMDLQNERIRLVRSFYAIIEMKKPKTCEACGRTFFSQYAGQKYCSKDCRKEKTRRTSIRNRCRKYGVYYDPSVTPKRIFKRDGYICMICGLACDKNDKSWNGFFGPYSPTVDHILALANGGDHVWDNVQCAHAICNSYKRDLLTV